MKRATCVKCRAELEHFDDLIECSNCGSIMRLSWEPFTLELVEYDAVSEKIPVIDEAQIIYEAEMAKIKYLDLFAGKAELVEINISNLARALRFLRLADYLLTIICTLWLLGFLSVLVQEPIIWKSSGLFFVLFGVAIFLSGICTGYRHIGVIDNRIWNAHVIVLPIIMLFFSVIALALFMYLANNEVKDLISILILRDFYHSIYGTVIAFSGLISVLLLRKMKIAFLDIRLIDLLSGLRSQRGPRILNLTRIKRLNIPLGMIIGVTGAVILLGQVFIPLPIDTETSAFFIGSSWLMSSLGLLLLVRARPYFLVSADYLLSIDNRSPILFLRSFDDDEKQKYQASFKALLDYSLETRLSNHFTYFGPFIAIGSPSESLPVPGAARVIMTHREWLPRVSSWMSEASLIIMYCGRTNWVNWELAKIIETGCVQNLILMIPQVKGSSRSIRSEDISSRFDRLREVFKNTRWNASLAKIQSLQDVRALLFGGNGSIVVIRSRPRNRDSFHLAALVAHYIILNKNPISKLFYETEVVQGQLHK